MTRIRTLAAAAVLSLAAGAAAPVLAQGEDAAAPAVHVRLADVNFASADGRAVAVGRIEAAARFLCGGGVQVADIEARQAQLKCRKAAETTALADLNRQLQALGGRSPQYALLTGR